MINPFRRLLYEVLVEPLVLLARIIVRGLAASPGAKGSLPLSRASSPRPRASSPLRVRITR